MSDQELKPCPFCQQPLKVVDENIVHPFSWCILSGVIFPVENATTWNTRTPDPMLEELAEALEKALNHGLFKQEHLNEISHVWEKYQQSKVKL